MLVIPVLTRDSTHFSGGIFFENQTWERSQTSIEIGPGENENALSGRDVWLRSVEEKQQFMKSRKIPCFPEQIRPPFVPIFNNPLLARTRPHITVGEGVCTSKTIFRFMLRLPSKGSPCKRKQIYPPFFAIPYFMLLALLEMLRVVLLMLFSSNLILVVPVFPWCEFTHVSTARTGKAL